MRFSIHSPFVNSTSGQYQKSEMNYKKDEKLAEKEPLFSSEKKVSETRQKGTRAGFLNALIAPLSCCFPAKEGKEKPLSNLFQSLDGLEKYSSVIAKDAAKNEKTVSNLTQRLDKLENYGSVLPQDAKQEMLASWQAINELFHSDLALQEIYDALLVLLPKWKHIGIELKELKDDAHYVAVLMALTKNLESRKQPIETLALHVDHTFDENSPAHNLQDIIHGIILHPNVSKILEIRFPRPHPGSVDDTWMYAETMMELAGKEIWNMDWSGCGLDDDMIQMVAQCWIQFSSEDSLKKIENLKVLHIDHSELTQEGVQRLLQNVFLSDLMELNLSGSQMNDDEKKELGERIYLNRYGKEIAVTL